MADIKEIMAKIDDNKDAAIARMMEFLRIPSVSTDPAFAPKCQEAAAWAKDYLEACGFESEVKPTAGHPVVIGRSKQAAGGPKAFFYGHYDVQPAGDESLWQSPAFEPEIRDDVHGQTCVFARGASDDKGQLMTFLEACRAYYETLGAHPIHITVMLEGEEEIGSPNLAQALADNVGDEKFDVALVCDTGQVTPDQPAITTQLRGILDVEVTFDCAKMDLHSGLYGGAAANPIQIMADVLGAIHDDNGRVTIDGFYDGVEPLDDKIKQQWLGIEEFNTMFLPMAGLSTPQGEKDYSIMEQVWSRPTVDFNGIVGGYTGPGSMSVIPATASAKLTCRLVPGQETDDILAKVKRFIEARVPQDCRVSFSSQGEGAKAIRFDHENSYTQAASAALAQVWGKEPLMMGCGGSIPVAETFVRQLTPNCIFLGFSLITEQIHSPNENYGLLRFGAGMKSWVAVLAALRG